MKEKYIIEYEDYTDNQEGINRQTINMTIDDISEMKETLEYNPNIKNIRIIEIL